MELQKQLRSRIVKRAYEKAVFYDRKAQNPSAAYQAYKNLLEEFPVSEWTDTVQQRIKELQPTTSSLP